MSFSNAGGFDQVLLTASGGANNTFGFDDVHFGGRCNGFADVQPSDIFCNAAEWLANRGLTLGCAAGLYCAGDPVSRGAMALFMNRLGNALSPKAIVVEATLPGSVNATASSPVPATVCTDNSIYMTNVPEQVIVSASIRSAGPTKPAMPTSIRSSPPTAARRGISWRAIRLTIGSSCRRWNGTAFRSPEG